MNFSKTCPLASTSLNQDNIQCIASDCSLWSEKSSMCSILAGMAEICSIADSLKEIAEHITFHNPDKIFKD